MANPVQLWLAERQYAIKNELMRKVLCVGALVWVFRPHPPTVYHPDPVRLQRASCSLQTKASSLRNRGLVLGWPSPAGGHGIRVAVFTISTGHMEYHPHEAYWKAMSAL